MKTETYVCLAVVAGAIVLSVFTSGPQFTYVSLDFTLDETTARFSATGRGLLIQNTA